MVHILLQLFWHLLRLLHPGILIQHMEDDKGRPLPPNEQYQEEIEAIFMVHWDNVNTIMHYPNRKGFDFPDQYRKKIGFRSKEKQEFVEK